MQPNTTQTIHNPPLGSKPLASRPPVSVCDPGTYRHIDKGYSAIKKSKLRADHTEDCYRMLRQLVTEFTTSLIQLLKGAGYSAYIYSSSRWLMIDTQVHVDIDGYTFRVWSFDKEHYTISFDDSYYDNDDYPASLKSYVEPIHTIQRVINGLHQIQAAVQDYRNSKVYCRHCRYLSSDSRYCGLGQARIGCTRHTTHP